MNRRGPCTAISCVIAVVLTACTVTCVARAPDTITVGKGSLELEVTVTGALEAVDSVPISPPSLRDMWDMKIAMLAPEGQEVEAGQPVAGFDPSELQKRLDTTTGEREAAAHELELERAKARVAVRDDEVALAQAKAELRKAEHKAEAPASITSLVELEKTRSDVELAQANIEHLERKHRANRRREQAQIAWLDGQRKRADERVTEMTAAMAKLTVLAPRPGTLIYATNWNGEKKKVGDSTWRAETLMHVASLDDMSAAGQIDEVDASKVAVGQRVTLRLDAQADRELTGTITKISQTVRRASPENPLKVVTADIKLDADAETKLRPGMRFRGRVAVETIDDVLVVPISAVHSTPHGPRVRRREDSRVVEVPVELGRRDDEHVEVRSGLDEGDEIVVETTASGLASTDANKESDA